MKARIVIIAAAAAVWTMTPVAAHAMTFHLLCWTNDTPALPSAIGLRPGANGAETNDWLVFTADDDPVGGTFNPYGALSHSFEDIAGVGGERADAMPSLSGLFECVFSDITPSLYTMVWERIDFGAQIEPSHRGHIQLVYDDDTGIVTNPLYGVNGGPNAGYWRPGTWRMACTLDFFAEHIHDNVRESHTNEVAHAHNDQYFEGWLVPLAEAQPALIASNMADDVLGFYDGSFSDYLTNQILPRLPDGATHLLLAQSPKKHVAYSKQGMTTNSLFGMTLMAYSYDAIPEPLAGVAMLALAVLALARGARS